MQITDFHKTALEITFVSLTTQIQKLIDSILDTCKDLIHHQFSFCFWESFTLGVCGEAVG
jgi:hypothetical protein